MNKLFHKSSNAFTVIELLVIAPIVILFIGAFITVIVSMTGEVLSNKVANVLVYDIQDTLSRIDSDIKSSTSFLSTNSINLTSPQGYDDATTSFKNVDAVKGNMLILNSIATSTNPLSTTSGYIYLKDKPNSCASGLLDQNTPMSINIVYFVKNGSLWRRTVMPSDYTTAGCVTPWQQPTCVPGYVSVFCKTQDTKLLDNVDIQDFVVNYYPTSSSQSSDLTSINASLPDTARYDALKKLNTAVVSLNIDETAAGRAINRSESLRSTRINTNIATTNTEPAVAVPSPPATLNARIDPNSPDSVIFDWSRSDGATSYYIDKNIGSGWVLVSSNSNNTTVTITGTHGGTACAAVYAQSSAGRSATYITKCISIPLWQPLIMQNGWSNYPGYGHASYTKTSDGVVVLKGLIRSGSTTAYSLIGNLPAGYRPEAVLIFGNTTNSNAPGRVDVRPDGDVVFVQGSSAWYSLDTIRFVPNGPYSRTNATFANSWSNLGSGFANITTVVDNNGRIWEQGMNKPGTYGDALYMQTFPAAQAPSYFLVYSGLACNGTIWSWYDLPPSSTGGGIRTRNVDPGTCMSQQLMWYPSSYSGWTALTLVNSWVRYSVSWSAPRYTKGTDNIVKLEGMISGGLSTYDSLIATLPAGYRPKERLLMTTTNNSAHSRIDILSNGEIHFMGTSNAWYSLDPISFIAEQ